MKKRGLKRTSWILAAGILLLLSTIILTPVSSQAQKYWIGGVDDLWSTDGNWNPSGVPQPGDTAIIDQGYAYVKYGYTYTDPLAWLEVNGEYARLEQYNGSMRADVERISNGAYAQYGGTNTAGEFTVSGNGYYNGFYFLGGGQLTNTSAFIWGTGYFDQRGGIHSTIIQGSSSGDLILGEGGTYALLDGTHNVSGWMYVGYKGEGYYNMSGGALNVTGKLYLGQFHPLDPGVGFFYQEGGTLTVGDNLVLMGMAGVSTFTQVGGTTHALSDLYVGIDFDGEGSYYLGGGPLNVAGNQYVSSYGNSTFTQEGGSNTVTGNLVVGNRVGRSGTYNLSGDPATSTLNTNFTIVGQAGIGTFIQSGGTHTVSYDLNLGQTATGNGSYSLSGTGILTVGRNTNVGIDGEGTFTQMDGTHTVTEGLILGMTSSGNGTYDLSGGEVSSGWLHVGSSGTGTFTQSGGINTTGSLVLGVISGSSGTYNFTSGLLDVWNITVVGNEGTGAFNLGIEDPDNPGTYLGDGTHNTAALYLGFNGGSGTYNLYSGTLDVGGFTVIGGKDYNLNPGIGEFNQYGGMHNTGGLWLGDSVDSVGTYNLFDGELIVNSQWAVIGMRGTGIFNQTGGTFTTGGLALGGAGTGNGTYNLELGTLTVNGNMYVGDWGKGTFTQSGGTATVSGNLVLASNPGTTGTYNLSGDPVTSTLNTNFTIVGQAGTGTFTQSGGIHTTDGLVLGQWSGSSGTYNLSGTGYLSITNDMYIGVEGTGSFTQSGSSIVEANNIFLGTSSGSGSYELKGGNLSLTGVEIIGYNSIGKFTQSGGTHTVTGNLYLGNISDYSDPDNPLIGNGTYNLSGTGSLIVKGPDPESDPYRDVTVGFWGNGIFTQADNSNVSITGALVLGGESGGYGKYEMSGGTLTTNFLQIGRSGNGDFIQTGGTVTVTTVLPGDLNLGQSLGSEGLYDLSGASSQLTVGRNLNVGLDGRGTFNQDKGSVNVGEGLIIAGATTANGSSYTLKAGEVSSDWLYIGFNGTGTFTQDGGTNTTGALYLALNPGSSGTYTQKGGTNTVNGGLNVASGSSSNGTYNLNDGSLTTTGYVWVGYWGTGVFNQTGGIFDVTNPSAGISIASQIGSTGEFNLSGGDLKVTGIESVGTRGTGTFTQIGSSTNTVDGNLVLGNLYAGAVGTYNLSGTGKLKSGGTIVGNLGTGTFNQYGGTHEVSNNLTIGSTGTYNKYGGTLNVSGNINNNGTFNFTGGDVITSLLQNYGLFKGSGASFTGSVINYGTVNPGLSPGTLNITGNYTQDPLGILLIELAGYEKGTEYDFLNITGTATLGGTLKIDLLDIDLLGTFNPVIGSIFNILYADQGRSGTFAFLDLPAFGDGRGWEIDYGSNDVTVRVTPIPSTLLLLGSGLIGFVGLMRRKLKR